MRRRKGIWLAGALLAAQLLSGCSIGGKEVILTSGMGSRDVFRIDGVTFSLTEAKVYLANFQNIYGKTYGIDLWEQKFQNGKLKPNRLHGPSGQGAGNFPDRGGDGGCEAGS